MDAKKTIEKLRGESDRLRMSLYLSQSVFNEFKEVCNDISPSKVIEELMRDFVADSRKKKVKSKKSAIKNS